MARKHNNIDDYISGCSPRVVPLLEELWNYVHATLPGATEDMQYGVPVFLNADGVPVIYLFGSKRHLKFGFLRSANLTKPDGELRGSGTPSKHIRVVPKNPIDRVKLTNFVKQCETIGT